LFDKIVRRYISAAMHDIRFHAAEKNTYKFPHYPESRSIRFWNLLEPLTWNRTMYVRGSRHWRRMGQI